MRSRVANQTPAYVVPTCSRAKLSPPLDYTPGRSVDELLVLPPYRPLSLLEHRIPPRPSRVNGDFACLPVAGTNAEPVELIGEAVSFDAARDCQRVHDGHEVKCGGPWAAPCFNRSRCGGSGGGDPFLSVYVHDSTCSMRESSEVINYYQGEAQHEEKVERAVRDIASRRLAGKTTKQFFPGNHSPLEDFALFVAWNG